MHGGRSTGPKSPQGIERIRQANTKHGAYSREHQDFMRRIRQMQKTRHDLIRNLKELARVNAEALLNSGLSPEALLNSGLSPEALLNSGLSRERVLGMPELADLGTAFDTEE